MRDFLAHCFWAPLAHATASVSVREVTTLPGREFVAPEQCQRSGYGRMGDGREMAVNAACASGSE